MSQAVSQSASSQQQGQQGQQQGASPSRGKLVQRLLDASASLPAFINDLLTTQAVYVNGTEAAAFLVEKQGEEAALRPIAHIRPDDSDTETRHKAVEAFQGIVGPCVAQRKDGAIEVGTPDGGEAQFCLVTLLRNEGEVVGVSAVITRARDMERAKQRLTSMQLVAGYFELFSLRRYTEQAKLMAERHQQVLQYTGSVATAEGFEAAAMGLCNELANRTGASRVSLGWIKGRYMRVKALSHTEKFDKKQELIVQLEKVMEECVDQEEPVKYDPAGQSSGNVTRAARELSLAQGGNGVLSVPLRRRDEICGVIVLEFPVRSPIDPQVEAGMGVAAELLAPQLYDRYENDRFIAVKAGHSVANLAKLTFGPKHTAVKLIILSVLGFLAFILFYKTPYGIRAPFQLVAQHKHVVPAPYEGVLEEIYVKPGMPVKKDQPLIKLKTFDLELKLNSAESQMLQKRVAEADLRKQNKIAEAQAAHFEAKAYEAQAELLRYDIKRATVTSPVNGVILRGDLFDHRGAPVKQGDALFEIAQSKDNDPDQIAVEAEVLVNERDIQDVKRLHEEQKFQELAKKRGFDGKLSTSSFPNQDHAFKIKRIVPSGDPKDGENVFKVYVDVAKPEPWMHPGLAGEARVEMDKRSIAWIYTHRLGDWLRLKRWHWMP